MDQRRPACRNGCGCRANLGGEVEGPAKSFQISLYAIGGDQIEEFINHLAERAAKDREGLLCQLNSYAKSQEVAS